MAIVFLVGLNIIAHFLPFERASLGNDDYAILVRARQTSMSDILSLTPRQPERPLAFLLLMAQEKLMDGNAYAGLWSILVVSSAVLVGVFLLLNELLGDPVSAVSGAVMFCLMPNKLEVYHQPIMVYMDVANCLYLGSLLCLLRYATGGRKPLLALSLAAYLLAVFTYPTGAFLPLSVTAYLWLAQRKPFRWSLYFAVPTLGFLVMKFTRVFGFADQPSMFPYVASARMLPTNLFDLAHHYLGRYLIRNLLYGASQFARIEPAALGLIAALNVGALFLVWRWARRRRPAPVETRLLALAAGIFLSSLIPILSNGSGGVGGRHLVLPSIGVAIAGAWLVARLGRQSRTVLPIVVAMALVVCQGNAWSQVVACRINGAVYGTLGAMREALQGAERVVIDTRSFAERIPFTWVQRDFNVLNTYYGAQAFESWGLKSMVRLVVGSSDKAVYVASERPRILRNGMLEVVTSEQTGYRAVEKRTLTMPRERTLTIDFHCVFGEKFNRGVRTSPGGCA